MSLIDSIAAKVPGFRPKVAVVLGTGLGSFAEEVEPVADIPYAELPGFPQPTVRGHAGQLRLGRIGALPVAVLRGRTHYYESGKADGMRLPIETLAALGCETVVLTNAAGSLRMDMPPGGLMAIADHINFTGVNPLFGHPQRRFVDMVDTYDPVLLQRLVAAAKALGIVCHTGVYIWFCGPSFETPAEIRAARTLGADAVGMSTAPEAIVARHAGMKVVGLSVMTNYAAGMVPGGIGHEQTISVANAASQDVRRLLRAFLEGYS
ncbi:MAG: purine-nucleoside phosphorylase [Alphaproteobacteria bacterium]|nr:MAG: purine-nucleoside phosphorylase [Alphaproteobacteria bacterium]